MELVGMKQLGRSILVNMPRLPLQKPLNARDSLAFLMYVPMVKKDTDPVNNEILNRFCKRTGVDRHDYITAVKHPEWLEMLAIMQKNHLLVTQ